MTVVNYLAKLAKFDCSLADEEWVETEDDMVEALRQYCSDNDMSLDEDGLQMMSSIHSFFGDKVFWKMMTKYCSDK